MNGKPTINRAGLPRWEALSRTWHVEPPLAPDASDIDFYERVIARECPGRVLMLGVTPGIAAMHWPEGIRLTATDWAEGMLRKVWPADRAPAHACRVRADWRQMPYPTSAFDFVIGDGCYSVFDHPDFIGMLNAEVARILRPGGIFCIRCHRRPARLEPLDVLFGNLLAGHDRNLDLFRWKLATAVQGDAERGVRLKDVWEVWHRHIPDPIAIGSKMGWTERAIANMEAWRNAESAYVFPSLDFLLNEGSKLFSEVRYELPEYEWGEQFPRLMLRR